VRRAQAIPPLGDISGQNILPPSKKAGSLGRRTYELMAPRFKGVPKFDFSLPCPACGYKIQPSELLRLASHTVKCPRCGQVFDEMGGAKPLSTS
jgi:predicted Zn finger-like uncharacterized protein